MSWLECVGQSRLSVSVHAFVELGLLDRPRDGKNLTIPMVHHALHVAFHMSDAAASALTHTIKPFLRKDGTFDLIDLRKHGVMEHDASLTRLDFHQGDNYTFQPQMLENMIQDANGGDVTLRSLAKSFNRRCRESRAAGAPRMGLKLWFVTVFQLAGRKLLSSLGILLIDSHQRGSNRRQAIEEDDGVDLCRGEAAGCHLDESAAEDDLHAVEECNGHVVLVYLWAVSWRWTDEAVADAYSMQSCRKHGIVLRSKDRTTAQDNI